MLFSFSRRKEVSEVSGEEQPTILGEKNKVIIGQSHNIMYPSIGSGTIILQGTNCRFAAFPAAPYPHSIMQLLPRDLRVDALA